MSDLTVAFEGENFRIADSIGLMPLMKFAKVAKGGADSSDLDGLVAMYDLLESCLADDEWERFQNTATRKKATNDTLLGVVRDVIQALSGRPTSRPSVSSDGPTSIEPSSAVVSSSPEPEFQRVVERLEAEGRPDKAYMVLMAEEQRRHLSVA